MHTAGHRQALYQPLPMLRPRNGKPRARMDCNGSAAGDDSSATDQGDEPRSGVFSTSADGG